MIRTWWCIKCKCAHTEERPGDCEQPTADRLVEAKTRQHFDDFIADVEDIIPYVSAALAAMIRRGEGFTPKAVAYRKFLDTAQNWRESETKPLKYGDTDICSECEREISYNGVHWIHMGTPQPRHRALPKNKSLSG